MNVVEQARKHALEYPKPAPNFFEGALLGNGGMGVVVTTRPDSVVLHFGHNNVWDVRVAEDNQEKIGTFAEVFEKVKAIPTDYDSLKEDAWYRDYLTMTRENYAKPYPRPMPCGSLILAFDRRKAELLGHTLHIADGLCEVYFQVGDSYATLQLFVDLRCDTVWMNLIDTYHKGDFPSFFERIRLLPDSDTPKDIPPFEHGIDPELRQLFFQQTLPFRHDRPLEPDSRNKAFRVTVRITDHIDIQEMSRALEARLSTGAPFIACVQLEEGLQSVVSELPAELPIPVVEAAEHDLRETRERWKAYWDCSGVVLEDELLERIWYRNLYFFNCSISPDSTCPGLYANWSYQSIGSSWHGDYHMNYNTQQPFWLSFSSNHVDKHIAYVNMIHHILPMSKKWAEQYYGLRGAFYPHTAYPVEMNMNPYPVPHWGWEVCETPWAVQSLWWHYTYTLDKKFLNDHAYPLMKEAVLFMVDYMQRPEAHGEQWGDDKYHIFPTVPPELYQLTPGFDKNYDCLVDLTLTKFLFNAFIQACDVLETTGVEEELLQSVQDILHRFPAYPTAMSQRGTVFVSVPGEDPEVVYNVPNGITTIFPGEDHGLHSPAEEYEIAANSYRNHRNEGGNELVFLNLAGARLGLLDLERFKRQIEYCMLPNGTCTDKVLQTGGRYSDTTKYDYMGGLGIWFENFALPVVVNECLMQSYNGVIRLFPNWPMEKRAQFHTLRAVGGFLVSAASEDGDVQWIEVRSEAGTTLCIYSPWSEGAKIIRSTGEQVVEGTILKLETSVNEHIRIVRATPQGQPLIPR